MKIDRRSLKILDVQTMKVGNHYQTPLPLKNPDVKLPNNRKVAERRLLYLKKLLMKDNRFHQQYTKLIQEILEKGYAKESNQPHKVEEFGIYPIMVFITHGSLTKLELSLTAAPSLMEGQLTRSF